MSISTQICRICSSPIIYRGHRAVTCSEKCSRELRLLKCKNNNAKIRITMTNEEKVQRKLEKMEWKANNKDKVAASCSKWYKKLTSEERIYRRFSQNKYSNER